MTTIEINLGKFNDIDADVIKRIIKETLEYLKKLIIIKRETDIILSVALVAQDRIAGLNKQYRQKDVSTDVLSFCYKNDDDKLEGEIILAPEIIKENARKDQIEFKEELKKNIIHSVLHIIGYEHGDKMFSLQEKIFNKILK